MPKVLPKTSRPNSKQTVLYQHLSENVRSYKGLTQSDICKRASKAVGISFHPSEVSQCIRRNLSTLGGLRSQQGLEVMSRLRRSRQPSPNTEGLLVGGGETTFDGMTIPAQLNALQTAQAELKTEQVRLAKLEQHIVKMAQMLGLETE